MPNRKNQVSNGITTCNPQLRAIFVGPLMGSPRADETPSEVEFRDERSLRGTLRLYRKNRARDAHCDCGLPGTADIRRAERERVQRLPNMRCFDGFYYDFYLHVPVAGHNGYMIHVARSADLAHWDNRANNPVLEAGPGKGLWIWSKSTVRRTSTTPTAIR